MIILGIDPGSRVTGYGLIRIKGNHFSCIDYGCIVAGASRNLTFPERLKIIYRELDKLVRCFVPDIIAVESVFYAANVKSALLLGHARGVILLAAAQHGVQLVEYSPLEIKKAVVGYGGASKEQIQHMVRRLLNLKEEPQPHDAADALAIALCHAFNGSLIQRLGATRARS